MTKSEAEYLLERLDESVWQVGNNKISFDVFCEKERIYDIDREHLEALMFETDLYIENGYVNNLEIIL